MVFSNLIIILVQNKSRRNILKNRIVLEME